MISMKKGMYALLLGIGLSASVSTWAFGGCDFCRSAYQACQAGDQASCNRYEWQKCDAYYPTCL